jgi:hypothetical protein
LGRPRRGWKGVKPADLRDRPASDPAVLGAASSLTQSGVARASREATEEHQGTCRRSSKWDPLRLF